MAQVRNISNDPRHVRHLDRVVGLDELLDVPDREFVDRTWATSTWQLVTPPADSYDVSTPDAIWWNSTPAQEPAFDVPAPTGDGEHDGQEQ